MNLSDNLIYFLFAIFALLILAAVMILFVQWILAFRSEFRYIQNEINRTYGKEKEYWKRKKRRLLLSLIPFVRYR